MKKFSAITLIILMSLSFASCGSSNNNTDSHTKNEETVQKFIGEHGALDDLDLVVNSVKDTNRIDDDFTYYEPESGKYAVINVTIKNNTNDSVSLANTDFKLKDSNDAEFIPTSIFHSSNEFMDFDSLNPHLDITTNLLFEIPKESNISDYRLEYHTFTSEVADSFVLKEK